MANTVWRKLRRVIRIPLVEQGRGLFASRASGLKLAVILAVKTAPTRAATERRFAKHRHEAIRYSAAPQRTDVWTAATGTPQF